MLLTKGYIGLQEVSKIYLGAVLVYDYEEPVVVYRTLTVVVNGLSEAYEIWIDGVEQPTNTLQFEDGTILDDVAVTVDGYTIAPLEYDNVVMNQNRTLTFTATPNPPTDDIVDDINNTFDWTNNPSFTNLGDYEFTINGGSSYSEVTEKPILVIGSHAIGQVGVRVKAVGGNNPSTALYNSSAFSDSNKTPLPGFSFLSLPAPFTSIDDQIWNTPSGADMPIGKQMTGDGAIALKITADSDTGGLYVAEINDPNTSLYSMLYNGYLGQTNVGVYSSSGNVDFNSDFALGDYAILERVSGVWKLYKSTDGVNLTEVTSVSVPQVSGVTYILVVSDGTIAEPQGKGLTDV